LLATDPERVEDPGFLARRILDAVSVPLKIKEQDIFLTASIGISIFPHDATEPELLLANAETAMRQSKLQARGQFRYYSGQFNQIASRRLTLETELRRAISRKEFRLYYQPRVDSDKQRVVGAECLLRWQHPERGIVAPLEFLSVLEETGLIQNVGYWVLEESMQALQRWCTRSLPVIRLAVNLSARQFHEKQLPEKIQQIADKVKLDLTEQRLELEITESLLMDDISSTRNMLQRLHEMGLKIAIDDFGTGYSALSYLITFPLDHLKIDKSFVDKIQDSDDAKAIVEAIISLSYSLHLNVIAEGVETREQLVALQSLGCKQFQGYLFARPMPEEEFIKLMSVDEGRAIATMTPEDRLLR
jgi:EAL domain-containing protein (putative c-di-GMP-specific phosphodiesterase class I)